MNKCTGTIVRVGTRMATSNKTGKSYKVHNVTMSDGQTYEVGFNPLKGYNAGDNITFMWEVKFGKPSIDLATVSGAGSGGGSGYEDDTPGTTPAPAAKAPYNPSGGAKDKWTPKVFPVPKDNGDRSICRQNALTNARELYCSMVGPAGGTGKLEDHVDAIIGIAYKFEEFTTGDREVNAAKADAATKKQKAKQKAEIADEVDDAIED